MQDDQKRTLPDGRMVREDPFYLLYGDSGVRVVAALMCVKMVGRLFIAHSKCVWKCMCAIREEETEEGTQAEPFVLRSHQEGGSSFAWPLLQQHLMHSTSCRFAPTVKSMCHWEMGVKKTSTILSLCFRIKLTVLHACFILTMRREIQS